MKIVIGFAWFDSNGVRNDLTIVGNGGRGHVDAIVERVPAFHRQTAIDYLKPFVEGGRPSNPGQYSTNTIVWWKPVNHIL